jgi:hypothetical protein
MPQEAIYLGKKEFSSKAPSGMKPCPFKTFFSANSSIVSPKFIEEHPQILRLRLP